jgi:hypothetical protein
MATDPEVTVTPAQRHQELVLSSLSQLYVHDLSDVGGRELDESGRDEFRSPTGCWPVPGEEPAVPRVGSAAVRQLVAGFPGRSEIQPFPDHAPAVAFWATVCAELAADGVNSGPIPGHTMPGAQVLAFNTERDGQTSASSMSGVTADSVSGTPRSLARLSAIASSRRIRPATASLVIGGSES